MTVVTTVFFGSLPCLSMRSAHSAMTASPSTTCPRSSTMITRSASPSSAMPMAAPLRTTSRATCSGWSAPMLWLMFLPLGLIPSAITSAPSSPNTSGATT